MFAALIFSANAAAVTAPIGTTPGSFAVSPSGAATYSIPIFVPPGTNGMQPQVSLNYNSQAGNGLLGIGWSIGGLSVIHRCGRTIAIDGIKGGVNYDANDKFCLDGERLIPETAGSNVYRTQHESWQKIVASDTTTNPASFTVHQKDGTMMQYGVTEDSRIQAAPPNGATIRLWALNKIQDTPGNYLTVEYNEDNNTGDYQPSMIWYTANEVAGLSAYNVVMFNYAPRSDVIRMYEGGSLIESGYRLANIAAYTFSPSMTLTRKYILAYDNNGAAGRSRLKSIKECGTDNVCLPATNLSYQNNATGYAVQTTWSGYGIVWLQSPPGSQLFISGPHFADLDGDGRKDYVTVSAPSGGTTTHHVSLSTGTGYNNQDWVGQSHANVGSYAPYIKFLDLNGDGKSDSVISTYTEHLVALSTGSGYSNQSWPASPSSFYAFSSDIGDFNGDGRDDLISVVQASYVVELSKGNGFDHFPNWSDITGVQFVGGKYGDLNGDGRTDYAGPNDPGYYNALISTGTGFDKQQWPRHPSAPAGTGIIERMADLNGDGKKDLVIIAPNGVHYVSLSTGKSYDNQVWTGHPAGDTGTHFFADVNGDSKDDYITVSSNGTHNVSLSTGAGYINQYWPGHGVADTGFATFTDLNGDGQADYVTISSDGTHRVNLSNGAAPDLLVSVTNGFGAKITITYKPLSDSSVHSCVSNTYPYKALCDATYVVSTYTQSNGLLGGDNATSYQYSGMLWHHEVATGLGFANTFVTDAAGQTLTIFNQILDGTEGTVKSIQTWDSNLQQVKYVSNAWQSVSPGPGRTLARLTASSETNYVLGTTTNTTYGNYDAFSNARNVVVDFNDGWTKTTINTYDNDETNWILGKLRTSKVTATAPGQGSSYRESAFSYNPITGHLLTEVIEPNRPTLTLMTAYEYDPLFGNRTKKTISGPDITPRDEYQLTFDPRGQFVTTRKNALNHPETFTYDARTGAVVTATDANNITTTYSYNDGFGRKTQESRPGSPTTDIYYECWDGSVPASGVKCPPPTGPAITRVRTVTSGAGENYAYHDLLGRVVQTNTQGFNGDYTYKETQYDNLGRVTSVSHPYFGGTGGETPHYTTYTYDTLGRVLSIIEPGPGDRETTTEYNGLSTTVTSPPTTASPSGQVKTTVKNSQGLVATVTDAAGTTTYTYYPFGNLTNVAKDYDPNAPVAMTYDERGRKKTINDPDMGAWSYDYNTLGELTRQTDAKGQKIDTTYDVLGRLETRKTYLAGSGTPETSSAWAYGTVVPEIGKLKTVSNTNANETYVYDSLSRLSSQTTSISGVTYTTAYTYDANGRVLTLTYPITGFKLYHVYNPYGYLSEVHKDTASGFRYWLAVSADAHGRITWETLGNNLVSTRAYDHATGDLNTINTGPFGNNTAVQNSSFSFDALDNLRNRSWFDGTALQSETFGYDADGLGLNRLTSVSGPVNKTYQYSPNGNISYKSDTGFYFYPTNGVRPHGVTTVMYNWSPTYYVYDANGNMTTRAGRTLTYTSFNKSKTIQGPSGTTTLTYDANFNRLIKTAPGNTTTYIGKLYEKTVGIGGFTTHKHYLYAGNNLVGAYTSGGTTNTRYFHTDHLGSVEVITNESGGVVQRLSYDAWGKRRNPNGTDATNIAAQATRGFTRHEHDDEVGLVNMNAREYDYVLGRFISPDTIVQFPHHSQSYNRYTYVNNNPLSFTDPTGHGLRKWAKRTVKKYGRTIVAVGAAFMGAPMLAHGLMGGGIVAHGIAAGAIMGQVMGGNTESTLRGGFFGGVTGGVTGYYAPSALGNNLGGANGIAMGSAKFVGQHIVNAEVRDAVGEYAHRRGYSLTEFNLGLFGLSALGNVAVGSRFQTPTDKGNFNKYTAFGISGWGTRGESTASRILGLPFDILVDTPLALQGLPTASLIDAVRYSAGMPLSGHSLGSLDLANMGGLGLLSSGTSYALRVPFGKVVVGAEVEIGKFDPVSFFVGSGLFNPDASFVPTGHDCPGCTYRSQ